MTGFTEGGISECRSGEGDGVGWTTRYEESTECTKFIMTRNEKGSHRGKCIARTLVFGCYGLGGKEDCEDWGCGTWRRLAKRAQNRYTYSPCGSKTSLES